MMRRAFTFDCKGALCAATLDLPGAEQSETGLLIVTGGNEIRSGAHRGQAQLAKAMAARGHAVMRYDRRGTGDSEGDNRGWRNSADDLAAAVAAFRAECPTLKNITGFGNCDGASVLLLHGRQSGVDAVIAANPWTYDHDGESGDEPSPDASTPDAAHAKAHYLRRLANPLALMSDLFSGRIDLAKVTRGISSIAKGEQPSQTGAAVARALDQWGDGTTVLIAAADRTAIHFESQMKLARARLSGQRLEAGSHSFAGPDERDWLYERVDAALKR